MSKNSEQVIKKIKHIRKSKRLSVKDCAKALGFSKETYRSFEEGTRSLTLPELETLSFFLGVAPSMLLEDDQRLDHFPSLLNEDIRPHYLTLRNKMIGALITSVRVEKALSYEDIHEASHIPEDLLESYENGETPIPLPDLLKISNFLAIPHNALIEQIWLEDTTEEKPVLENRSEPEFSKEETTLDDSGYTILLQAFQQVSAADQAHIAKIILEKLRT